MRVAAIYDVHGNLPALDAVLEEAAAADVDVIVVGGDVASGPMPAQTLDRLRQLRTPVEWVRGNADRELADAYDRRATGTTEPSDDIWRLRTAWAAAQLRQDHRDLLAGFRDTVTLPVDGVGETLFCHGSPRSDEEIITAVTSDERLIPILADVSQRVVVCGHTHHQFDRLSGVTRVVNAGSVGLPYEGRPGIACWALLGDTVELRQTGYDLGLTATAIRQSGIPGPEELIADLEHPPGAQEVAEFFEAAAGIEG
ncbi:MAG: hypothetical protein QOJ13_846 [Gaiellales bacterium]|jgi:predicted phosphodiesterase|nr:hypothetical protein [Gaiellales bacterium]